MAIKYPSSIEHNNSDFPLVYDSQFKGGAVAVIDKATRNAYPEPKRQQYMIFTYSDTSIVTMRYKLSDVTDINWQNDLNWDAIGSTEGLVTSVNGHIGDVEVIEATGLESITEDGDIGWRLIGRESSNLGSIGGGAIDISLANDLAGRGATGAVSYAEGYNTVASGIISHAEGNYSVADGFASHSEGFSFASGDYSHSQGFGTIAKNNNSHAAGIYNIGTSTTTIHETGIGTSGVLKKNAFEIHTTGKILAPEQTLLLTTEDRQLVTKEYADKVSGGTGLESITEGGNTGWRLVGKDAVYFGDIGEGAVDVSANLVAGIGSPKGATGDYSHAEGYSNTASGDYSHAEGTDNEASGIASHVEGSLNDARGLNAHAEGYSTSASGFYSHSECYDTTASGEASHAEGSGTTAAGDASHAEGSGTTASNFHSHAEGVGTVASGEYSHAEGGSTLASGTGSHSEGQSTSAIGTYSHAEGLNTVALGSYSHAEGSSTATGDLSHAEGNSTEASGPNAHSEGSATEASGPSSHAEGVGTIASGSYSHAQGFKTMASGDQSHASGKSFDETNRVTASGQVSFNHSSAGAGNPSNAEADLSAILGGQWNNITSTAWRSVIIGGSSNTSNAVGAVILGGSSKTAIQQDTVYMDFMRLTPKLGAPATPEAGTIYYHSGTNKLKCFDGTDWKDLF